MKPGAMLINTRGALVETQAVLDDLITGHQAFSTKEAAYGIGETTNSNATAFESGKGELHRVDLEAVRPPR